MQLLAQPDGSSLGGNDGKPVTAGVDTAVRPMGPGSLADAMGISSSCLSLFMAATGKDYKAPIQHALGFHRGKYLSTQVGVYAVYSVYGVYSV
jgi:hypothetical protein